LTEGRRQGSLLANQPDTAKAQVPQVAISSPKLTSSARNKRQAVVTAGYPIKSKDQGSFCSQSGPHKPTNRRMTLENAYICSRVFLLAARDI